MGGFIAPNTLYYFWVQAIDDGGNVGAVPASASVTSTEDTIPPEAINDLGEGRTQVAYLTPSTYVIARKKYGVVLLAKALRGGKPFQHSVIVTRKESGIGSIDEIRGHSFAFA